MNVSCNT